MGKTQTWLRECIVYILDKSKELRLLNKYAIFTFRSVGIISSTIFVLSFTQNTFYAATYFMLYFTQTGLSVFTNILQLYD